MKKLVAIVGTNSKKSTNRDLLYFMKKHFSDHAEIEVLEIDGLPVFNKPADKKVPAKAQEMAQKISQADGVIISTAEYNHTIPSPLTNALNWLTYYMYPFANKAVLITGASYGRLGSSRAQIHLRQILNSPDVRARLMPNLEFMLGYSLQAFDEEGNLKDSAKVKELETVFKEFLNFIDASDQYLSTAEVVQEAKEFTWEEGE